LLAGLSSVAVVEGTTTVAHWVSVDHDVLEVLSAPDFAVI
jgi:hypothetical protein